MDINSVNQGTQGSYDFKVKNIESIETLAKDKKNDVLIQEDNHKELKKAVEKLNKFLEDDGAHAEYSVHDKFNDIMIKIVDNKTKEVILEVPPKKILDMVAKMCELVGVVFDKKA